jgi:hypothetical protein
MEFHLSGNVVLGEFCAPPSQAVALADIFVAHAEKVLQQSIEWHGEISLCRSIASGTALTTSG